MCIRDRNYIEGLRTVARFAPKPFYFVTSKGKGGLLTKLDEALHSIEQTDPYFMTTLHEKYFNPSNKELKLTAQEKEYVENTEPVSYTHLDQSQYYRAF